MCCAIGALLIGALAAWRKWSAKALDWCPQARWTAASAAAVMTLIAGIALAAEHADHYTARRSQWAQLAR
ncbi:hypothetical protein SAMN05444161_2185 [Rhizobiales bacterium GAS191]|nr:hypothetical protein SAMN05444161_2185 [Rhizobiales bacterium GAS191]